MTNTHTFKLLGKAEYFGEFSNSTDGNITRLDNSLRSCKSLLIFMAKSNVFTKFNFLIKRFHIF